MIIRLLQTWLFSNIVVVGDILYLNLSLYSNKCDNIIQGMQIQGLIYNKDYEHGYWSSYSSFEELNKFLNHFFSYVLSVTLASLSCHTIIL